MASTPRPFGKRAAPADPALATGGAPEINAAAAKKQRMLLAGIGGVAVIGAAFYVFDSGGDDKSAALKPDGTKEISISSGDLVNRNLSEREWIASSGNRLDSQDQRLKSLEGNNPRLRELEGQVATLRQTNQATLADGRRVIAAYEQENAALKARAASRPPAGEPFRAAGAGPGPEPAYGPAGDYNAVGQGGGRPPISRGGAAALAPGSPEIRVISFTAAPKAAGEGTDTVGGAGAQVGRPDAPPVLLEDSPEFLPPNSYAPARVLVGVDAAAGVASQTDPLPVVLRITGPARSVVNRGRVLTTRVEGCVVNGAARADLSSEKIYVKLAKMTCDQPGGRVAVSEVKGFLSFGGKAGVRGRVVSREGGLVGQALLAGIVGGFGRGFAANANAVFAGPRVNLDAGGGGNNQRPQLSTGDIVQGGLGQGVGDASDMVSKYLIERAEQYQPVIEMPTGIDVDIVFLDGVYVRSER